MRSAQLVKNLCNCSLICAIHVVVFAAAWGDVSAATPTIDAYVGVFEGKSVNDSQGALTADDIDVEIRPAPNGFLIDWRSATVENDRVQRLNHEVIFERASANNVYRMYHGPNTRGVASAPPLIDGEPYFWARLTEDALIVYVMKIERDGSVDLRIYLRSVEGNRLRFEFTRLRDKEIVQTASGVLRRRTE